MLALPSKEVAVPVAPPDIAIVLAVANLVAVPALPVTVVGAAGNLIALLTTAVDLPLASTVICGMFTLPPKANVAAAVGPYDPAVTPLSARVEDNAKLAVPLKEPDAVISPVRDMVLDVVN